MTCVRSAIHGQQAELIRPCPGDLVIGGALGAEPVQLLDDAGLGRCGAVPHRSEVRDDGRRPDARRIHDAQRVREPLHVAELREEPTGHTAPKQRAHHLHRGIIRIAHARAQVTDEDLGLLGGPLHHAALRRGHGSCRLILRTRHASRQLGEESLGGAQDALVLDASTDREHELIGSIQRVIVRQQFVAREPLDGGAQSQIG